MTDDANDENHRLRRLNAELAEACEEAEADAAKAHRLVGLYQLDMVRLEAENERLSAERDRYRSALAEIATETDTPYGREAQEALDEHRR